MIVDGHQSRLDPKFVDYINNKKHPWKVCLGVPYATTLWQVGDASEQNGMAKMEWYREKTNLSVWKYENNLPHAIRPDDVMPLLNRIFYKAYGNVANNKKAVAVRGWYPPNMKLLEHPSLVAEAPTELTQINVQHGLAGSVLDRILRERSRSEGAKRATEKRKLESNLIAENLQKSQRLTSGVLTQNAIHSLSDPRFLKPFHERRQEAAKKEQEKQLKRRAKTNKIVSAVCKLRKKYGHEQTHFFEKCDKLECGAYLQYKKQKKDHAMPKDLAARRERCVEWMSRPSPILSPQQSDDEESASCIGEGEHNAVQGCLGCQQPKYPQFLGREIKRRMTMDGALWQKCRGMKLKHT